MERVKVNIRTGDRHTKFVVIIIIMRKNIQAIGRVVITQYVDDGVILGIFSTHEDNY